MNPIRPASNTLWQQNSSQDDAPLSRDSSSVSFEAESHDSDSLSDASHSSTEEQQVWVAFQSDPATWPSSFLKPESREGFWKPAFKKINETKDEDKK